MTTILCVADDPGVLAVLARILRRDGLKVRSRERKVAGEQEYPGITMVKRGEGARYEVPDPEALATELELGPLVDLIKQSKAQSSVKYAINAACMPAYSAIGS